MGNISNSSARWWDTTVHPHVCGEHKSNSCSTPGSVGSSPRVWGTWVNPRQAAHDGRFIPTCVGNMALPGWGMAIWPVHPHVCGEHGRLDQDTMRNIGSSPRVWGTCLEHGGQLDAGGSSPRVWGTSDIRQSYFGSIRFIPTCVGNMVASSGLERNHAVHPHVCGEHAEQSHFSRCSSGSSPRVWGTCSRRPRAES